LDYAEATMGEEALARVLVVTLEEPCSAAVMWLQDAGQYSGLRSCVLS